MPQGCGPVLPDNGHENYGAVNRMALLVPVTIGEGRPEGWEHPAAPGLARAVFPPIFPFMTHDELRIQVVQHPFLRPAAFMTRFPYPLGELPSPTWLTDLMTLGTEAPVQRDEALRMAVRDMLRHWGHKPAGRGKPASEYLVRAVDRGELGSINAAVDVCNVVSLHSGFPIALVDLDRAHPPFHVAPGTPEESYIFNVSGQEMSLKGLICLRDAEGPCANPVKDAQRTKTNEDTTHTLTVMWGVAGYEGHRDQAVAWYQELLEKLGASVTPVPVVIGPP